MLSLMIGFVASLVVFTLLAWAGSGHLVHARATTAIIREQRLLPDWLAPTTYAILTAAEVVIGYGGLALAVIIELPSTTTLALYSATTVYFLLTVYTAALLRWRPHAPCGCSVRRATASRWTLLRSACLAGTGVVAIVAESPTINWIGDLYWIVVSMLMAATLATLLWLLPDAMPDSERGFGVS